jgi:hypothetical protein
MVMATKGKTDKELWIALEGLDDDLFHLDVPEALVDEELKAIGVDSASLAKRGCECVAKAKDDERLSWQVTAQQRRAQLHALAETGAVRVPVDMTRNAVLARLNELRAIHSSVGSAIKIAARKRKHEESTDDELRALLEEMEALRAIESNDPE